MTIFKDTPLHMLYWILAASFGAKITTQAQTREQIVSKQRPTQCIRRYKCTETQIFDSYVC